MEKREREACIGKIEALPARLEEAVRGLTDAALDTAYRDGGWTVRQVVHHLADSHANAYIRTRLALTEERPTLKPYEEKDWAKLADAHTLAPRASIEMLRGIHVRWVALLHALPAEAFERVAHHPDNGDMTVDDIIALYSRHGETHLAQILGAPGRPSGADASRI